VLSNLISAGFIDGLPILPSRPGNPDSALAVKSFRARRQDRSVTAYYTGTRLSGGTDRADRYRAADGIGFMQVAYIAVGASICLAAALVEAWLIVAHFTNENGPVAKLIPGGKDLLRSHIDYLMMAQFLFVFYGLFRLMSVTPPVWVVATLCFGSFFNPFAFLVRAINPSYLKAPPVLFKAMLTVSCVATTVGYGATAWMLARTALSP
jgi:hypothetical protein